MKQRRGLQLCERSCSASSACDWRANLCTSARLGTSGDESERRAPVMVGKNTRWRRWTNCARAGDGMQSSWRRRSSFVESYTHRYKLMAKSKDEKLAAVWNKGCEVDLLDRARVDFFLRSNLANISFTKSCFLFIFFVLLVLLVFVSIFLWFVFHVPVIV